MKDTTQQIKIGSSTYSVTESNGRFRVRLWDSRQQKQINVYGKTLAELRPKVKAKLSQFNEELQLATNKNVEQYFEYWLKTFKFNTLKSTSYDRLERIVRVQIVPVIGTIKMKAVTTNDIQKVYETVAKDHAYSTIKKVHEALNGCFKHAFLMGDITKNPMLVAKPPREKNIVKPTKEIQVYTDEQIKVLVSTIQSEWKDNQFFRVAPLFILMLNTGLRIGEALALKHSDIDLNNRVLMVNHTLSKVVVRDKDKDSTSASQYILTEPKTKTSKRKVDLNTNAVNALKEMEIRNKKKGLGYSEFVFCSEELNHFNPRSIEDTFKRICARANLPYYGLHSLRHTFVSRCFSKGIPIEIVSELVGHSSVSITRDVYLHILPEQRKSAIELLDAI